MTAGPDRHRAQVVTSVLVLVAAAGLIVVLSLSDRIGDVASPDQNPRRTDPVASTAPTPTSTPRAPSTTPSDLERVDSAPVLLQWAPPPDWKTYEPVELDPDGGRLRLADDVDYRVVGDDVVTGSMEIIGGRNVVWIGGEIAIDGPNRADEPLARGHGLTIRDGPDRDPEDSTRIVHLEGLLLRGDGLTEGINVDAPTGILQIQNVRVDALRFASADDRDGTGPYVDEGRNHPDVLQTYGGHTEVRIDGLSGRSGYQGLFLKIDHDDGRRGTVHLRRVDIQAIEFVGVDGVAYAGNRMYFWDAASIGDQFVEHGTVWIDHHPNAGKVADEPNPRSGAGGWWHGAYRDGDRRLLDTPPGTAMPADAVERLSSGEAVIEPRVGTDRFGRYVSWPVSDDDSPSVLDADGDEAGRLHLGRPPGGPYVPIEIVGVDYRSPGYRSPGGGLP